ncbi:S-layer protein [Methanocaldococcus indicus]|uniref:S-layer protein n=1 Tax=Methanocaldococcus indicus TaxID=213231 RepID=UPI003C6D93C0
MIKKLFIITILTILPSVLAMSNPIIVVNKSTVDYINSQPLLDDFYSYIKYNSSNNTLYLFRHNVDYIFADDILYLDNSKITFERDNNSVVFKYLYVNVSNPIILGNYKLYKIEDDYIILKSNNSEEFITNSSFSYKEYNISIVLVSLDYSNVIVNISKNSSSESIKLNLGKPYYYKDFEIIYSNYSKYSKKLQFKVYDIKKISVGNYIDGYKVVDINSKYVELEVNKTNKIKFLNYLIEYIKSVGNYSMFKVIYNKTEVYNLTNKELLEIDNNLYAINNNGTIYLYYKDRKIDENKKLHFGLEDIYGINLLKIDRDIILIGGPVVNKYVRYLIDEGYLKVNITNNYPGKGKGVIAKIKNPYNNKYYIYVLAGSDRVGTKKAIEYFISNRINKNIIFVN